MPWDRPTLGFALSVHVWQRIGRFKLHVACTSVCDHGSHRSPGPRASCLMAHVRRVLQNVIHRQLCLARSKARIPLRRLSRNFPVTRVTATCYGEVTGMFRGFKPSQHVEMVWKIPLSSRQQARLHQGNGESATFATRHGEVSDVAEKSVGIVEFGLKR